MSQTKIVIRRVPEHISLDILILYIEEKLGEGTVDDQNPDTRFNADHSAASICLNNTTTKEKALQMRLCVQCRPLVVEDWKIRWEEKCHEIVKTRSGGDGGSHTSGLVHPSEVPLYNFIDEPLVVKGDARPVTAQPERPMTAQADEEAEIAVPPEKLSFVYKLVTNDKTMPERCRCDKLKNGKGIEIVGTKRAVAMAQQKILDLVSKVDNKTIPEFSKEGAHHLVESACFDKLASSFNARGIDASISIKDDNLILIAKDAASLKDAEKVLRDTYAVGTFSVPPDYVKMAKTERWKQYVESLKKEFKLCLRENGGKILLEGLKESLDLAIQKMDDWLAQNTTGSAKIQLLPGIWQLLKEGDYFKNKGLSNYAFIESGHFVQLDGKPGQIDKMERMLKDKGTHVCESNSRKIIQEGLDIKMLINDPGKSKLRGIEMHNKCVIELVPGEMHLGTADFEDSIDLSDYAQAMPKRRKEKQRIVQPPRNLEVTKGSVTESKASVLVCTIPYGSKSLDKSGILGKIFGEQAGNELIEDFNRNRKINLGDVYITDKKGSLNCNFVIFACIRSLTKKNRSPPEAIIKSIIGKCIEAVKSRGQHSVAFPTIGSGRMGFPQNIVARCFSHFLDSWNKKNPGYAMKVIIAAHEDHVRNRYQSIIKNEDLSSEEEDDEDDEEEETPTLRSSGAKARTTTPTTTVVLTVLALDKSSLLKAMDDTISFIKSLLQKRKVSHKIIKKLSPEDMDSLKRELKKWGIDFTIETDAIYLTGVEERVSAMEDKVREILDELEEKIRDPDEIRKREGDMPYLVALSRQEGKIPKHWKIRSSNVVTIQDAVDNVEITVHKVHQSTQAAIDQLVQQTWNQSLVGHGADAVGLSHSKIKVKDVCQIENPKLFMSFYQKMQTYCREVGKGQKQPVNFKHIDSKIDVGTVTAASQEIRNMRNPLINEFYLFHGTPNDTVHSIQKQGIDTRVFSNGLFGKGAYFAESSTKADQYSDRSRRHGGDHFMFLCRVLMLDPFVYTNSTGAAYGRAPCKGPGCNDDKCKNGHEFHDSVLGVNGPRGRLNFREFVVYDRDQCYPEFLIRYERE